MTAPQVRQRSVLALFLRWPIPEICRTFSSENFMESSKHGVFVIQICRKIRGLGCVTRALVLSWFTQPRPRIFLHICIPTLQRRLTFLIFVKMILKNFKVHKIFQSACSAYHSSSLPPSPESRSAFFFEAPISRKEIPLWGLSQPRKNGKKTNGRTGRIELGSWSATPIAPHRHARTNQCFQSVEEGVDLFIPW